jgi:hypothetical protein
MSKLISTFLLTLTLTLTSIGPVLAAPIVPPPAPPVGWGTSADEPAQLCTGLEFVFSRAVQALVGIVGLVIFIMLIVGGFKLITSGGDPKAAEAAKNTLTHAAIGAALLVLSIFILRLIAQFTGVDVRTFKVC